MLQADPSLITLITQELEVIVTTISRYTTILEPFQRYCMVTEAGLLMNIQQTFAEDSYKFRIENSWTKCSRFSG